MSRIGRQPIEIPSGVDVDIAEDSLVTVKGPRGTLTQRVHPEMKVLREDGTVRVERPTGCATTSSCGTSRAAR